MKWSGLGRFGQWLVHFEPLTCYLLVLSTVGSFTVPVGLAVTLNYVTISTRNGEVGSRDNNGVKVVIEGVSEGLSSVNE